MALKSDTPVYAIVAPAVAGQFEPELKNTQLRGAFKALGFTDIKEVAVGADLCTIEEAKDFMKEVPEKTSVFPAVHFRVFHLCDSFLSLPFFCILIIPFSCNGRFSHTVISGLHEDSFFRKVFY